MILVTKTPLLLKWIILGTPIFGNIHPSSARILLEWSNAPEGRFGWRMLGCRGLLPRRISRIGWEWLRNLIQKYQTCPGSSGSSIFLEHQIDEVWWHMVIHSHSIHRVALSCFVTAKKSKTHGGYGGNGDGRKENCLQQIQLVTRYDKWSGVEV